MGQLMLEDDTELLLEDSTGYFIMEADSGASLVRTQANAGTIAAVVARGAGAPPPGASAFIRGLAWNGAQQRILATDSFDRANSTNNPGAIDGGEQIGNAWFVYRGRVGTAGPYPTPAYGIIDTWAYKSSTFDEDPIMVHYVGVSDCEISFDFRGAGTGIIVRMNGQAEPPLQDYIVLGIAAQSVGTRFAFNANSYDNGAWTRKQEDFTFTKGPTFAVAQTYRARVRLAGSRISCWLDDVLVLDFDEPEYQDVGHQWAGVQAMFWSGANTRYNNWRVVAFGPGFTATVRFAKTIIARNLQMLVDDVPHPFIATLRSPVQALKRAQANTRSTTATLARVQAANRLLSRAGTILATVARRLTLFRTQVRAGTITAVLVAIELTFTVDPTMLEGRIFVVVRDAAGVILGSGPIYADEATTVERLDKLGEYAFTLPAGHEAAPLLESGRTVEIYREGVGIIFAGLIETLEWTD